MLAVPVPASALERTSIDGLPALIARPAGDGRHAAVVLMPGCRGLWAAGSRSKPSNHMRRWLRVLPRHGLAAIAVASRCGRAHAAEAFAAMAHLRTLPYVSRARIGILGWADGGTGALAAVAESATPPLAGGFKTAVAFYPTCLPSDKPSVPVRVLAAGRDRSTSACRDLSKTAGPLYRFRAYTNARRGFDDPSRRSHADAEARRKADRAALNALRQGLQKTATAALFAPDSWRNAPLAADAATDPDQSAAAGLRYQVERYGTWVATTDWSSPVYVVGPGQARVAVQLDHPNVSYGAADRAALGNDLASVPLPPEAYPAGPAQGGGVTWSDQDLIVHQPATDTAWEIYHLTGGEGQWWATDGGKISHVSESLGGYDPWPSGAPHGVTGSSIPLLTGLQRVDELQRGAIDHAVGISIPHVRHGVFRSPATSTDGEFSAWDAVPEGARFRLPPDLDVDALPLTPYAKTVARAIQRHGLVVLDRNCRPSDLDCPAVTFKAESARQSPDPYEAIFGGVGRDQLFKNFPWDRLQLLTEG